MTVKKKVAVAKKKAAVVKKTAARSASTKQAAAKRKAATAKTALQKQKQKQSAKRKAAEIERGPLTRRLAARGINIARALKERTEPTTEAKIAERRKQVQSEARKPWRRAAIGGVSAVAAVIFVWVMLQTPLFAIRTFGLEGSTHQSVEEVQSTGGLKNGTTLLNVSPRESVAKIETLPWVATANVRRIWPDEVRVRITERVPAAVVAQSEEQGAGWLLIDATGRVLAPTPTKPKTLAQIVEPGKIPEVGGELDASQLPATTVAALLPVELVSRVAGVVARPNGDVDLVLSEGVLVNLGPASDVARKLQSALTILERADLTAAERIDIRTADAPVVVRRPNNG